MYMYSKYCYYTYYTCTCSHVLSIHTSEYVTILTIHVHVHSILYQSILVNMLLYLLYMYMYIVYCINPHKKPL